MKKLSDKELLQYSRQIILPEIGIDGQSKLKDASVLCIGAGGIGSPVLYYLAGAGIGRIGIIDYDTINQENLPRQLLYTESECGQLKAKIAEEKLKKINSYISLDIYSDRFSLVNAASLVSQYDIIIDGTDNFDARYLINDAAFFAKKPLISGSVYQYSGQISVFNYQDGPCYRCLYPHAPEENLIPNCAESGVLGMSTGIIGSMIAMEAIKIILNISPINAGILLDVNTITFDVKKFKFEKSSECILCSKHVNDLSVLHQQRSDALCSNLKTIDSNTLRELLSQKKQNILIIDVRDKKEFHFNHIPGSINISYENIPQLKSVIDKENASINILYCQKGGRSLSALKALNAVGYENVYILVSGIESWFALSDKIK